MSPTQTGILPSWIELGEKFYEAISERPVPLDIRALRALKSSPLALDLYAWTVHRSYALTLADKPSVVMSWRQLMAQLGADYATVKDFRRNAVVALRKVKAVYGGLRLETLDGRLVLHAGLPPVPPRLSTNL